MKILILNFSQSNLAFPNYKTDMFFFYNHSLKLINLDGLKTSNISLIEKILFKKILKELFLKKT